jgi:hypothetical protein
LAWEEELMGEFCELLSSVVLQVHVIDRWIWQLHASSKYNVSSVYNYLTSTDQSLINDHSTVFWHKKVPLKVNIFAWRLLRNPLPATDNLIRRIFQRNSQLCSRGCGSTEDIDHLFLTCDYFSQIWYALYNWLGLASVKPALVINHLIQFHR